MPRKRYKLQSRRLKPKRSRLKKVLRNRFFWFGMVSLFGIGGVLYGIFFTPVFEIKHIEIQGAEKISTEKVRDLTKQYIVKKLVFFEINNLFLANVSKVAEEIENTFPEVEMVTVDTTFPNKVKVTIQERGGIATWCQQKSYTVEISGEEEQEQVMRLFRQCFTLDSKGFIFEEKEIDNEIIIEGDRAYAALGEQVIEPELLVKILAFQQKMDSSSLFREVGLRISTLFVVSEQRVNAKISEGWEIYLNPEENMDWQITKVQLVLEQEIPFEKRALLEYIDLRFGDQAYIKYR